MRIHIPYISRYPRSSSREVDGRENSVLIRELTPELVPRSPRGGGGGSGKSGFSGGGGESHGGSSGSRGATFGTGGSQGSTYGAGGDGARLDRMATAGDRRHPARSPSYRGVLSGGPVMGQPTQSENPGVDRIVYTRHRSAPLRDPYLEWMATGELPPQPTDIKPLTSPSTRAEREDYLLMRTEAGRPDPDGHPSRHLDTMTSKRVTTIRSSMRVNEVMQCLVQHGCQDITGELDPSSSSSDPIACGGTSNIYLARLRDGTEVAVKCLSNLRNIDANGNSKILKRTAREVYAWSKCDHPGVLRLRGVARFRGQVAVVIPWMKNGTLSCFLREQPYFNRIQLCVQLAEALEYMHAQGIIHGDIKTANVLMSSDNTPLFTDFGNALLTCGATLQFTPTTSLGITHRYIAPEILKGDSRYSVKADIYAFGMLLLEIITGQVPFADKRTVSIVYTVTLKKKTPSRPDLSTLLHSKALEEKLWRLLKRCWVYKPNKRPSATQLREELASIWQCLDNMSRD